MIRDVRSRALHFQAYLCLHNHHSNLHNALWQMSRMLSRHESVDDEFELRGVEETENLVSKDINNRGGGNVSRVRLILNFFTSPDHIVIIVSLLLFAALSKYFYVPTSLYLYLVLVCFTMPSLFAISCWKICRRAHNFKARMALAQRD